MGIKKSMTGSPWHIEKKTYVCSPYKRNCFNCTHLQGHWCTYHKQQITNNNAEICGHFKNINVKPKPKPEKKIVSLPKENKVNIKPVDTSVKTTAFIVIHVSEETSKKIFNSIYNNKEYKFRILANLMTPNDYSNKFNINTVYIRVKDRIMLCTIKRKSLKYIPSGDFITLDFIITDLNINATLPKKFKDVAIYKDDLYGMIKIMTKKGIVL